jgi:hypothetical protein
MTAWMNFFGIGVQGFVEKRFVTPAKAGVQNIKINKIINTLLLPGVQPNPLHPLGGANLR